MEVVMQGLRAHSDSFLAAIWPECYVLLHYFERTRDTKGGLGSEFGPLGGYLGPLEAYLGPP